MVYLSIMTMFKDEAMNMEVWMDHYRWQGVEAFHMIDNGSTDDSVKIIKKYKEKHPEVKVYIYDLPERHAQVKNYNTVFNEANLKENTKWLIICDLDEFFYCPSGTIRSNLPNYEDHKMILCHWKMFGSNGLVNHPEDIRTTLTTRVKDIHINTKYIVQTAYVGPNEIHIHTVFSLVPEAFIGDEVFPLNHYPIQSEEFFRKVKMTRGDGDSSNSENVRDMNYFRRYDEGTDFVDEELKNLVLGLSSSVEHFSNQSSPSWYREMPKILLFLGILLIFYILYLIYLRSKKTYRRRSK